MKIIQALLIGTAMCGTFACKCQKDTAKETAASTTSPSETKPNATPAAPVTTNQDIPVSSSADKAQGDSIPSVYRVAVSFISFGAGTDQDGRPMLDKYVQQYMDASSKRIIYDAHPWGREGEIDICFTLDNLSASEQAQFVTGLQDVFKGRELVHVLENKQNTYRR